VNGSVILFRNIMQKFVTFSVTEAKIAVGVIVAEDMLYMYRLLKLLKLKWNCQ